MRKVLGLFLALPLCAAASDVRLPAAARQMDRDAVRSLLASKADVNSAEPDGATALHWAVNQEDVETAALLVKAGANVKAANRYGMTPLALACTNGNAMLVDMLVKAGADANAALPGGETALMTCARTGKLAAVEVLLKAGADAKAKEPRRGQTALMWAAAEGHAEVVEALLSAGADPRARVESGFTPFLFAVREGHVNVAKVLLAKAGVDVNEAIKPSPASGRMYGASRAGTNALLLATINAHFELGEYLLEKGANPNDLATGWAPLHALTGVRKPGGGDNNPAPRGSGRLSSLDFIRKLKAHGADLNLRMSKKINVGMTSLNTVGATPFLLAARSGDAEMMRALAALGADPLIPTADGATPLIVAAGLGTRSPGEDAGTESEVAEAVAVALELGNNIDAVDNNGETAMHGAAYKNLPAVVELLGAKGAKIEVWNRPNRKGWTPLLIAEGYRFGNFKPSLVTVAAIHKVMRAAGVEPPPPTPAGAVLTNSEYRPPAKK